MPASDPLWLLSPDPDQVRGVTSSAPAQCAVDLPTEEIPWYRSYRFYTFLMNFFLNCFDDLLDVLFFLLRYLHAKFQL